MFLNKDGHRGMESGTGSNIQEHYIFLPTFFYQEGSMMKRLFRYSSVLAAAACMLGLISNVCARDSLKLCTEDLDSTYPNYNGGAAGIFPSRIPYPEDPQALGWGSTLGFVGDETHAAWYDVVFPGKPTEIVVRYGSPNASNIDFFLDSNQTGFWFWSCALPATGAAYYPLSFSDTCRIDYTQFPSDPTSFFTSGPHKLFIQFSCGVSGCGNYQCILFYFDGTSVGARNPLVLIGPGIKRAKPAIQVVNSSAANRATLSGLVDRGVVYDVRGRLVTRTGIGKSGIVIVKNRKR
jgi:hypothetical protein